MNDIQKCILDIFKEVSVVCQKHNIDYFSIGGTCIGAIRHKGFIPWDDDLDIAIPIEKFDEFIDLARKELPDYLEVYTDVDIVHYHYIFIKIIDKRTTFIENTMIDYPDAYRGIFVDIMPLGGVPDKGIKRFVFATKLRALGMLDKCIRFEDYKSYLKFLNKILNKFFKFNYFSNQLMNLLKKYPLKKSNYTGYVWRSKLEEKLVFPMEYFSESIDVDFENTKIKVPKMYDEYLSAQFGDYMKLPSADEREGHHYGIIDLNIPYKNFIEDCDLVKTRYNEQ